MTGSILSAQKGYSAQVLEIVAVGFENINIAAAIANQVVSESVSFAVDCYND